MAVTFHNRTKRKRLHGPRRPVNALYTRLFRLSLDNRVQKELSKCIRKFKKEVPVEKIAALWARGDHQNVLHAIPWDKLDLEPAIDALTEIYLEAAAIQLKDLPIKVVQKADKKLDEALAFLRVPPNKIKKLRFDVTNPNIKKYLNKQAGDLIKYVEDDAKRAVQKTITRFFTHAKTPDKVAEEIRGSIGLLPQHEVAVEKFRVSLQEKVDTGKMQARIANRMGDAYEEKLLDYRLNMIARTETRRAVNSGQLLIWQETVRRGYITKAKKVWVVDGNPCDLCQPMDGEEVELDDSWFLEDGTECFIPTDSHPHCMCGQTVTSDEIAEAEENSLVYEDEY